MNVCFILVCMQNLKIKRRCGYLVNERHGVNIKKGPNLQFFGRSHYVCRLSEHPGYVFKRLRLI